MLLTYEAFAVILFARIGSSLPKVLENCGNKQSA